MPEREVYKLACYACGRTVELLAALVDEAKGKASTSCPHCGKALAVDWKAGREEGRK